MDYRLILIGIIFLVLMVFFGNNPVQNALQKPPDPFRTSLEQSLQKQKWSANNASFGDGNSFVPGSSAGAPVGAVRSPVTQAAPLPTAPGAAPASPYPPGNDPNATGASQQYLAPPPSVAQPITWPEAQKQMQPVPQAAAGLPGQGQVPAFYLSDGRRIFFSGASVMVLGDNGSLNPLPDGPYALKSGDKITIRGGARVAQ